MYRHLIFGRCLHVRVVGTPCEQQRDGTGFCDVADRHRFFIVIEFGIAPVCDGYGQFTVSGPEVETTGLIVIPICEIAFVIGAS